MHGKLKLTDVTLFTATSVEIEATHAALVHSMQGIAFGAVKMLSPTPPTTLDPRVEYHRTPAIDLFGYSRLILEGLNGHIQTDHCLIVQADGFVIDPARWEDEFLAYDYIGAPWPESVPTRGTLRFQFGKNRVGNGGFSLRSKKLLETTARLRFDDLDFPLKSEDVLICHYLYDDMQAAGIRFAPPELAARFSIESPEGLYGQSFDTVFGFHGKNWLERHRARLGLAESHDAAETIAALPPGVPTSSGQPNRNASCPCGSGKRFKHCHGRLA
jgi:hypothetical protein